MTNETKSPLQEGLEKLTEDLKNVRPAQYCEEHKPCDAKEHTTGYQGVKQVFFMIFGSLIWGLGIMAGVNAVLFEWLHVVPRMDYWTAVSATMTLYILQAVRKGLD